MLTHHSAISLGLLYIPVNLYNTVRKTGVTFNQLCKGKDGKHQRIKTQKICPSCNKEVKTDEIVKGYEYEKDKYVIFSNEELERIKSQKDKTLHIIYFSKMSEIDSILFEKNYYLSPELGGETSYELLRLALVSTKKVAIAKTVLGAKEELVAIYPTKSHLVAKILFFSEELQIPPAVKKVTPDKKQLDLAKELIHNMTEPFTLVDFEDEYQIKLQKAIEAKINGAEIITAEKGIQIPNAVDLMAALEQTLAMTSHHSQLS